MNKLRCELFFSFFLCLYQWEEISKNLSLVIFVPQISQEFLLGSNPLFLNNLKSFPFHPPSLSFFSLFKWESPLGDFPYSSFLNDDFTNYLALSMALAICCVVTSLGWAAWFLTLSWRMTLLVALSLFFLTELDRGYDSLSLISYSPRASSPGRDLSSSGAMLHPNR